MNFRDLDSLKQYKALALGLAVTACGGNEAAKPLVVPTLSAQEAIFQTAKSYETTNESPRLLSPPSPVAIEKEIRHQILRLGKDKASEQIELAVQFEYRDGNRVECEAKVTRPLQSTYRFLGGEPAVKLIGAATPFVPQCTGAPPAEFERTLAASTMELVLRDESLLVVSPAADRRRFLPADDAQGLAP